jgi:hypothetical protein
VLGTNASLVITKAQDGGRFALWVKQDGTGGRTLTLPANCRYPAGFSPVLSTTPNALDLLQFVFNNGQNTFLVTLEKDIIGGAAAGAISVVTMPVVTQDLTAIGTIDWRYLSPPAAATFDDFKVGGGFIASELNLSGMVRADNPIITTPVNATWTDGMNSGAGSTGTCAKFDPTTAGVGGHVEFRPPAGLAARKWRIAIATQSSVAETNPFSLTLHMEDGSADAGPFYPATDGSGSTVMTIYEVTYSAGVASTYLQAHVNNINGVTATALCIQSVAYGA